MGALGAPAPPRWDTVLVTNSLAARIDGFADPSRWVGAALNAMQVEVTMLELAGWDRGRPLVLALFEPPVDGPVGTIAAGLPLRLGALPGLRHQIVVPASDREALRDAFTRSFDAGGLIESDAVRVVVIEGAHFPKGSSTTLHTRGSAEILPRVQPPRRGPLAWPHSAAR